MLLLSIIAIAVIFSYNLETASSEYGTTQEYCEISEEHTMSFAPVDSESVKRSS